MGRGDSSWQDRNHHIGKSRGGKKTSTGTITLVVLGVRDVILCNNGRN
jgi:hypothetical protein